MNDQPATDSNSAAHTVGQSDVNIDQPKTPDSNWVFHRCFRDGSVRQYQYRRSPCHRRCRRRLGVDRGERPSESGGVR
ncbi:hypothetical protein BRD12_06345 [Halobacteriales archaeon SW_12_67_38]|nr:MAG: hypothetical protein BRC68_14930 [Halobacteriales archaeon QH_6_64_20]PSQ48465.1 MAG: hypothetical protein BRD12_06345 [Halobacteriales archaeon SW_12_67_38]